MKHKKGTEPTFEAIMWLIRITIIGVFIFLFYSQAAEFIMQQKSVPAELEDMLYTERFVNSCFSRYDPLTSRTYPLDIDVAKFKQENLDDCYSVKENSPYAAYKLTLEYGSEKKTIETKNWAKVTQKTYSKRVYVNDDPAWMHIEAYYGQKRAS